ncbi:hypothetical protein [Methylopila turkensis]|uniref:Sensor histidine kinase n=1 Tax=Methylopila turkensis TaxID=1437816 RepID=A0A9W6JK58_9HYPH|nr:hypothetical protein [Methylopila turkensis]GLK78532.1 hypothetical protein GCM10008174_02730 [Methylopila turkensis]
MIRDPALSTHDDSAATGADATARLVLLADATGPDFVVLAASADTSPAVAGAPLQVALRGRLTSEEEVLLAAGLAAGGAFSLETFGSKAGAMTLTAAPVSGSGRAMVVVTIEPTLAGSLWHRFRNQVQSMTSLAALQARRLPPGHGQNALIDLRARFEALTAEMPPEADAVARVIERVVQLFDPLRRRETVVTLSPLPAMSPRRAALHAQVATELAIDLFRCGLGERPGRGALSVTATPDGGVSLRGETGAPAAAAATGSVELGLALARNLVESAGGSLVRQTEPTFRVEALIPPETATG